MYYKNVGKYSRKTCDQAIAAVGINPEKGWLNYCNSLLNIKLAKISKFSLLWIHKSHAVSY